MDNEIVKLDHGFLVPARVLSEDADTLTLQIPKNDDYKFKLDENDTTKNQFWTLVFLHQVNGITSVWKPWEGE